ncbi:MAG: PucR family transcriptional regulator ligand-binding domain-containing protein [Oscillospiraceae bacterium]|jgi:DNA-binding PucR family transcriptional regulator|nr:PucR family transcriptional regulator ligand-binding domain-containing protein [Oscillospiraceae bacterium]
MSLTIRKILQDDLMPGAEIRSGGAGAENQVSWVNVMEILDEPTSLQAGELLITTGFGLDDSNIYGQLLRRLSERGVSGIVIQTGYYIDRIPDYLLTQAETLGFPLLEIPKSLTFSSILRTLIDAISADRARRSLLASDSLDAALLRLPFSQDSTCALLLITSASETHADKADIGFIRVRSYLASKASALSVESAQNDLLCLFSASAGVSLEEVQFDLTQLATEISKREGCDLFIGISPEFVPSGIEQLRDALRKSVECREELQKIRAKRGVCEFGGISFFELFQSVQRNSRVSTPNRRALEDLFSYDVIHRSEYVRTLRVFLAHECNCAQTAARLYIHRHTLNNRLEKIRKMCGFDLKNYYVRLYLSLALLIHDYFDE